MTATDGDDNAKGPEPEAREDLAAQESAVVYADVSASSEHTARLEPGSPPTPPISQRRLVPPNTTRQSWWHRHRRLLATVEWTLIAIFLGLALYYLYLLVFSSPELAWRGVEVAPGRWRYIVLHHSATAGGSPEAFDRYHREKRGWRNGLGYHFVIGNGSGMADGEVAVGRRWREQLDGAHVRMPGDPGANSYCIGVALVGDFGKQPPSAAQLAALDRLLAFLVTEYGISTDRIVGHGQVSAQHTECPGKLFPLPDVIRLVAARVTPDGGDAKSAAVKSGG